MNMTSLNIHQGFGQIVAGCNCDNCSNLFFRNEPRPPVGIIPQWRHKELRLEEIDQAKLRYFIANLQPPKEWSEEAIEISQWLFKNRPKNNVNTSL